MIEKLKTEFLRAPQEASRAERFRNYNRINQPHEREASMEDLSLDSLPSTIRILIWIQCRDTNDSQPKFRLQNHAPLDIYLSNLREKVLFMPQKQKQE